MNHVRNAIVFLAHCYCRAVNRVAIPVGLAGVAIGILALVIHRSPFAVGTGAITLLSGSVGLALAIQPPRRLRRLTGKMVTAKTLAARPYALYRNPTECDSDYWGRPKGRYATLAEAMAATGRPEWAWSLNDYCPDETYILAPQCGTEWSIIRPGVLAEVRALREGADR
jgi:hypothetical protein